MSLPSPIRNYVAGGAIPAFTIVKFSAADTVVAATAATDRFIGVTLDIPAAAGERVDVQMADVAFMLAGGAIALGADIGTDSSGRGVSQSVSTTNRSLGYALEAASAAGDVIRVNVSIG